MSLPLLISISTMAIKLLAKQTAIVVPPLGYRVFENNFFPIKCKEFCLRSKPKHTSEVECRFGFFFRWIVSYV